MTNFREKLKEIRATQEQQSRRTPLTDEELGLNDGTEECLHVRDELVRHIERTMKDFIGEARAFSIHRGFFEGKYSISMACDELCLNERGEVDKCYSRINFLLSPLGPDHILEETAKLTVLNRDLQKAKAMGRLDWEADLDQLRTFGEAEMLRFAEAYFAARPRTPAPEKKEETVSH